MAFTPKASALHDQYMSMGMSNQAASDAVYAVLGDSAIQGAVPIATAGLPTGVPAATTAVDTGDYTPEAAALYDQYRSMGMSHVAAKEAVIAVLGQGAIKDVSMVPVAGPLGPAASPAGGGLRLGSPLSRLALGRFPLRRWLALSGFWLGSALSPMRFLVSVPTALKGVLLALG